MAKQTIGAAFEPKQVAALDQITLADGGSRSETLRRTVADGLRLMSVREIALKNPGVPVTFVDTTGALMSLTFNVDQSL